MVRMKLTFWHKDKRPGEIVEVREDEVHNWRGFAVRLPDEEQPAQELLKDSDRGAPIRAAMSTPKAPAAPDVKAK